MSKPELEIDSVDYHDFVIKDGKLIGEFEQMYQKSQAVPWYQDNQADWIDVRVTVELLRKYAPFDYICDFGCGLGYFLKVLSSELGSKTCEVAGYDISPTCCEKAKKIFPSFQFRPLNLMEAGAMTKIRQGEIKRKYKNKLFSARAILWYVFPQLANVIENINYGISNKADLLLVTQNFPPLDSDFVGKNVIPDPRALLRHLGKYFTPLKTVWFEDKLSKGNDNWFIGIFSKKS